MNYSCRVAADNYVTACKQLIEKLKNHDAHPDMTESVFKKRLNRFRDMLDLAGYKMPQPLFEYKEKDKTTWAYLDFSLSVDGFVRHISNPDFAFQDRLKTGQLQTINYKYNN